MANITTDGWSITVGLAITDRMPTQGNIYLHMADFDGLDQLGLSAQAGQLEADLYWLRVQLVR